MGRNENDVLRTIPFRSRSNSRNSVSFQISQRSPQGEVKQERKKLTDQAVGVWSKKDPEPKPGASSPDGYSGGKGGAARLKYTPH